MRKLKFYRFYIISIVVVFLINLGGCGLFFDEKEAREKVLSKDPSFLAVIEKKNEIKQKVDKLRTSLSDKKEKFNAKVKELKDEFKREKQKLDLEIKNSESGLDEYREKIKAEISNLLIRLKSKKRILKNIESTTKETNNLLSKESNIKLTHKERNKWQNRLSELKVEKKDIIQDIKTLEEELNIQNLKLKLLIGGIRWLKSKEV